MKFRMMKIYSGIRRERWTGGEEIETNIFIYRFSGELNFEREVNIIELNVGKE